MSKTVAHGCRRCVPCIRPPFGQMTAIDMDTQEVLWQRSVGTARNGGPFGWQLGIDIEMGMLLNGGSLVTASGRSHILRRLAVRLLPGHVERNG